MARRQSNATITPSQRSYKRSGLSHVDSVSILAARKLAQYEGGKRVPATISAIDDAIRWAEEVMTEIDRGGPPTGKPI